MAEHDSATVMFSKGEARTVIAALADDESTRMGRESERLLNLQDRFAATFDLDEGRGDGGDVTDTPDPDQAILGEDDLLSGGEDEEPIELSRGEAADIADVLADYDTSSENRDTVENVRSRLSETFGL